MVSSYRLNRFIEPVFGYKNDIGGAISTINYRVNDAIRTAQVRVIGPKGENVGIVDTYVALRMARDAELDLVEVSPNAEPPVCRIMDFGKFQFEHEKKEREARKNQTKIEIKEIRLRPKTNSAHRGFKTQDARKWLQDGMKVRVSIKFRGREITYPELALEDLKEIAEELADVAVVEQTPALEGKMMGMTLSPVKFAKKKTETAAAQPAPTGEPTKE